MDTTETDRDAYLDAFRQAATPALAGDLAAWQGTLEALDVDNDPAADVVYATATVLFRCRRYQYRRRVWPADHPAQTKAGLYATVLVERLLTTPPPAGPVGPSETVVL